MKQDDFGAMSDAELETAKQQFAQTRDMAARAMRLVQREQDSRVTRAKLAAMSPDERAALLRELAR